MGIKNLDGTPYRVSGSLQQFDPENQEFDLFNHWDEEAIMMGGAPIIYYEVFININSIDDLYLESRNKLWSPCGVELYAFYDPVPSQNYMGVFGMDSPNEMMFELNYRSVLRNLCHLPRIGSRIYTPHRRENWVVIQRNIEEYKLWGELRLQLMCKTFQESLTTGEGKVTNQKEPDFKLNDLKDLGKSRKQCS